MRVQTEYWPTRGDRRENTMSQDLKQTVKLIAAEANEKPGIGRIAEEALSLWVPAQSRI